MFIFCDSQIVIFPEHAVAIGNLGGTCLNIADAHEMQEKWIRRGKNSKPVIDLNRRFEKIIINPGVITAVNGRVHGAFVSVGGRIQISLRHRLSQRIVAV